MTSLQTFCLPKLSAHSDDWRSTSQLTCAAADEVGESIAGGEMGALDHDSILNMYPFSHHTPPYSLGGLSPFKAPPKCLPGMPDLLPPVGHAYVPPPSPHQPLDPGRPPFALAARQVPFADIPHSYSCMATCRYPTQPPPPPPQYAFGRDASGSGSLFPSMSVNVSMSMNVISPAGHYADWSGGYQRGVDCGALPAGPEYAPRRYSASFALSPTGRRTTDLLHRPARNTILSPAHRKLSSLHAVRGDVIGYGSRLNLCRVCGKTYARPSTLKTHMRTHSGEKPYSCPSCPKSFSQAANLTAHQRTHSGEKPFRCPVCARSFSQSSSVTTHMRTHSGERPYECRACRKTFSDSSTLTKHLRIHSGEKPYQCQFCFIRFSQSGNLNRHMRVHRNNVDE